MQVVGLVMQLVMLFHSLDKLVRTFVLVIPTQKANATSRTIKVHSTKPCTFSSGCGGKFFAVSLYRSVIRLLRGRRRLMRPCILASPRRACIQSFVGDQFASSRRLPEWEGYLLLRPKCITNYFHCHVTKRTSCNPKDRPRNS